MRIEPDGEEDHMIQEDHMSHNNVTGSDQLPSIVVGNDEPDFDSQVLPLLSGDDVVDGGEPEVCINKNGRGVVVCSISVFKVLKLYHKTTLQTLFLCVIIPIKCTCNSKLLSY